MPASDQFIGFLLDQLEPLGPIASRRMFGCVALLRDERMFALVTAQQRLFLKADEVSRARFVDAGCEAFTYAVRGRPGRVALPYFAPPDTVLDDREALLEWARLGIEAAARTRAAAASGRRRKRGA